MRLPAPSPRPPAGENVIPLINVVFLLLIFFMLAGSLGGTDLFRVRPPSSVSAAAPDRQARQLLVGTEGRLALDGETVSLSALAQALGGQGDRESPPIRVKADRTLPVARLMTVLKVLRGAGVERIELVTIHKAGE